LNEHLFHLLEAIYGWRKRVKVDAFLKNFVSIEIKVPRHLPKSAGGVIFQKRARGVIFQKSANAFRERHLTITKD
jgi:hypothetical protein